MQATHERANKNICRAARILAALAVLLFPLAASAAEQKASRAQTRAPARPPAAVPAKPSLRLLEEARAWEGWGENSRQGLDENFGPMRLDRFLLKPESRRASSEPGCELASGSFEYGFTGRENDDESGLMFYRARSYDPMTGRFTSRDPVPNANLYFYVENNPTNATDPSGRELEVTEGEFAPMKLFFGEQNVTFTKRASGKFLVEVSDAGFKAIDNYVQTTSGSQAFADRLKSAIKDTKNFYSLNDVQTGGPGKLIADYYEGNTYYPGTKRGYSVGPPDGAVILSVDGTDVDPSIFSNEATGSGRLPDGRWVTFTKRDLYTSTEQGLSYVFEGVMMGLGRGVGGVRAAIARRAATVRLGDYLEGGEKFGGRFRWGFYDPAKNEIYLGGGGHANAGAAAGGKPVIGKTPGISIWEREGKITWAFDSEDLPVSAATVTRDTEAIQKGLEKAFPGQKVEHGDVIEALRKKQ